MDIAELLAFAVKNKASDLHLSSGLPPMIRVDGDLRRLNLPALDNQQLTELLYSTMSDHQRRDFEANLEVDFSYAVPGLPVSVSTVFTRTVVSAVRSVPFLLQSGPWRILVRHRLSKRSSMFRVALCW